MKGEVSAVEPTRLQRAAGRQAAESRATVPDFTLAVDVDMTRCAELRTRLADEAGEAPTAADMVVKAAALALREHPRVNGAYRDGQFESYSRINVGIAVHGPDDAPLAPVIRDADATSLGEIARLTRTLAGRVRSGEITAPELSGATFAVSDLGDHGVDRFTAILTPPHAAMLTVGALARRPGIDEHGGVAARDQLTLTLVCDNRILHGPDAAAFLARVRELLEQPLELSA